MGCRIKRLPQSFINSQVSGLTVKGLITVVSINDSSWTPLPATPLTSPADRNAIGVQNTSDTEIKLQFEDGSTGGYVGWILPANAEFFTDITPDVILYARSETGTFDITVMEIA